MPVCDPLIPVVCDGKGCFEEESFNLTALAGDGWDDRYVQKQAEKAGWLFDGDKTYCSAGCKADPSTD